LFTDTDTETDTDTNTTIIATVYLLCNNSFGTELLVMASMRKPKRLTIHGNDERDYHVLVKGGEDLRLDERVEQVFEIMSEVYSADAACAKAKLAIRTFKVSTNVICVCVILDYVCVRAQCWQW
jgi:Phosphatidylinositol 3- and 4-kinase